MDTRTRFITDEDEAGSPLIRMGQSQYKSYLVGSKGKDKKQIVKKVVKKGPRSGSKPLNKQIPSILTSQGIERQLVLPIFAKGKDDGFYMKAQG